MDKKNQILRSAAQLFREKGYKATTMRDLAKAVGMEAASLYNHIPSKQGILSDILLEVAQMYMEGMATIRESGGSALQQLEALVALHIQIAIGKPNAAALMVEEWRHLEAETYGVFKQQGKEYEEQFRQILLSGMENGQIRDIDPDVALFSILSTLRWFHAWYARKEERSLEAIQQELSIVLINGLAVRQGISDS